ncbi:MAG TPA: CRISPR-associated endoribonuclease Cas6 [Chitinophagales bacterium]|nr:CRISPR-associated endoribonuclease Cas6 [Chitinophagales bacterium]
MRICISLSRNKELIPFNYQQLLTGVIHKWLGKNNKEHGKNSLYSFSWLQNTLKEGNGLRLKQNSYFFISAYDTELIKKIMKGILESPDVFCGSKAIDIQFIDIPQFSNEESFFLSSPVLIRKKDGENTKHVTYLDDDFESLLTENLKSKLQSANINSDGVSVELDKNYPSPETKLVTYKGISNKTSLAPLIIKGTSNQIAFAWSVGLGHSTGIGFGALK